MPLRTPDLVRHNDRVLEANTDEALTAFFAAQALVCGLVPAPRLSEKERGYQSGWEIRNDRLYLMKFDPLFESDAAGKPLPLLQFGTDGILAEWFTGSIYVNDANVDIHEDDLGPSRQRPIVALEFERGVFGLVQLLPRKLEP